MAKPDNHNLDVLRAELNQLLQKQSETLDARMLGGVSDTELIEYDLRQEIICEIQEKLARSAAASRRSILEPFSRIRSPVISAP
jgi:hypothetical protein